MGEIELLALYWTVSGPVEVHTGREWSLFDWRERCAHAARAGFSGLGLWHADLEHQLESRPLREIAAIFADAGLKHLELEFIDDFFLAPGDPARERSDRKRRLLLEAAERLPAHHIKVGNIPGTRCEPDRLVEAFAQLCDDAAQHTHAPVVYEFMPFDPNVRTLREAMELVAAAGRRNGALAIDTWHLGKLGIPAEELRRIPSRFLGWVELSDGPREDMPDLREETINHRRLPGEGEFEIHAYVEACRAAGYAGPWGVEVLSEQLRALPIEELFDRAYVSTMTQLRAGLARAGGRTAAVGESA
jgi:sugar phosphate isomerase/epimerase